MPEKSLIAELHSQFLAHAEELGLTCEVMSVGPVNSHIAIVGEGPGETEVRQKAPFVGGAGSLLFNALRKYGIHRGNTYVTNVVKRQISLSRKGNEKHVVLRDELDKWIGLLDWELSQLPNLRIVLVLGNYALQAILKEHGITNWRGSVVETTLPNGKTGKVVCTINPAYALRELKMEPMFLMDCYKLHQVNQNTFKEHKIEKLINPTHKQALDFIRMMRSQRKPVAYDIEVINGETACHGLANSPHLAMCINLRSVNENRFTVQEEADILLALQDMADDPHIRIVAQNGGFDAYWTRLHDWLSIRIWHDTLLAHHTLYPQLPHSLAFLCTQYTTHPFYKDEGRTWREGGNIDQFWEYNCTDAAITIAVMEREIEELRQQGLHDFFYNHVMRAQPHLVSATVHGLAVDHALKQHVVSECNEEVERLLSRFHKLVHEATGDENSYPNPNSPSQLKQLFFNTLQLKGRGQSTDKANREHILKNPQTPSIAKEMLVALDEYIKEDKFVSTFANAQNSIDGRFRCEYKQYGVARAPGRLSSSSLLTGEGGNLQNVPVRARSLYISDPGCVFVYFDLSQAEARIVAWRANIPKWKEQFEKARLEGGFDVHRALASEMFKVPYEKVPVDDFQDAKGRNEKDPKCDFATLKPTIRYIGKRCRHGLNYRMERFRLAEVTKLPLAVAATAFNKYHAITPELRQWWEIAERDFRRTREAFNAFGRRLKVIQRIDDDVLQSIVAFYPQSTIGDKVTQVWYQSEEDDKWPHDARICLNVHDNLVAICPPNKAMTCLRIMKHYAEQPIMIQDVYGHKPEPLIIPAECKISYPTRWEVDKHNKLKFIEDVDGYHRWSHMKGVKLS